MTPPWTYTADFVEDADAVFAQVRDQIEWTRQMASRQTASMGIPYNYAGASYPENPWHPAVAALRDKVGRAFDFTPTNCLINRYPTGEHTIGWHRDDVDILAPGTGIAIVSLGAVRTLRLRKGPPFEYTDLALAPGSLLFMTAELQTDHKHAIKREIGAGERISLTFRHLTHAPPPVELKRWS